MLLSKDLVVGAVHGFFNIDLENPLLPIFDGYHVIKGLIETYFLYKEQNDDYDIYQNVYDISLVFWYNLNPLSAGGLGSLTLSYLTPIIKEFIKKTNLQLILLPIFSFIALQWINDLSLAYDSYTSRIT